MADWVLVMPVKRLAIAKSRLASYAGAQRPELALAFASDTLTAAAAADSVCAVAVVTDDDEVAELARAQGFLVVADQPAAGLNPALAHGAEAALAQWPGCRVAALSSDLPALRTSELEAALRLSRPHRLAYVADAAGTGTTLLAAQGLSSFRPQFGANSALAHAAAGAHPLPLAGLDSLRRDVDTEGDLMAASALALGPASAAAVQRIVRAAC